MTKKILAIALAAVMVMALSVAAFADYEAVDELGGPLTGNKTIPLPSTLDISNGATVTLKVKGTSADSAIRFYLTGPTDNERVTDAISVPVVDGAFEAEVVMTIDSTGAIQGSADPTVLMIKGPQAGVDITDTTFESLVFVGIDAPAAEPAAEETPAADEAPAADAAPADTTPAPDTGLALAVIPAVMALAAVAVSKKH